MKEFIIPKLYNKTELKFFYFILSKLENDNSNPIKIKSIELYKICQEHNITLTQIVLKLKSKDVAVIKTGGIYKYLNIFDSIELQHGIWEINFDPRFFNAILELKKVSTEKAIVMFGLNSIFSVKLYNALADQDKLCLDKQKIRELFNQSIGTPWSRIEKTYLIPSIKEINRLSDINITLLTVTVTRKRYPTAFMFLIKQKEIKKNTMLLKL